jgi:predicted transcriptional regulator
MTSEARTPKEQMRRLLDAQPDDSSYDELLRELAFARMVDRGLADAEAGRVIPNEHVKRAIESWRR